MKTQLTLKHLAPYLPYGLKCQWNQSKQFVLVGLQKGNESVNNELWTWQDGSRYLTVYLYECKPILRPLSDFDGNNLEDIQDFIGFSQWCDAYDDYFDIWTDNAANTDKLVLQAPYPIIQYFLFNHYDIFGLIPEGLAIDLNTVK